MCQDQHKLPGEKLSVLVQSLPESRPLGDPIYARQITEKQTERRILVLPIFGKKILLLNITIYYIM